MTTPPFNLADFIMSLPIIILTATALSLLLIDLWVPKQDKWVNALYALGGIAIATAAIILRSQKALNLSGASGLLAYGNSMLIDRYALYFWYLFLAAAAISILL